jgi:hypothetical protein
VGMACRGLLGAVCDAASVGCWPFTKALRYILYRRYAAALLDVGANRRVCQCMHRHGHMVCMTAIWQALPAVNRLVAFAFVGVCPSSLVQLPRCFMQGCLGVTGWFSRVGWSPCCGSGAGGFDLQHVVILARSRATLRCVNASNDHESSFKAALLATMWSITVLTVACNDAWSGSRC